jgi:hypothetical protein
MNTRFTNRSAFRPNLEGQTLEERVVLSGGAGVAHVVASTAASTLSHREQFLLHRAQIQASNAQLRQFIRTQGQHFAVNSARGIRQLAHFRHSTPIFRLSVAPVMTESIPLQGVTVQRVSSPAGNILGQPLASTTVTTGSAYAYGPYGINGQPNQTYAPGVPVYHGIGI